MILILQDNNAVSSERWRRLGRSRPKQNHQTRRGRGRPRSEPKKAVSKGVRGRPRSEHKTVFERISVSHQTLVEWRQMRANISPYWTDNDFSYPFDEMLQRAESNVSKQSYICYILWVIYSSSYFLHFSNVSAIIRRNASHPSNQTQAGNGTILEGLTGNWAHGPTLTLSRICLNLIRLFKPDLYGPLILQMSIFVMTDYQCPFFL